MDINEKKAKIAEVLASGSPFTIGALGKAIEGSALEAARLLPAAQASFADGSRFDEIWLEMSRWEKVTFIVQHKGNVIEVATKLAPGKRGFGYYNIMGGRSTLEGHFNADAVKTIGFISVPFMNRESHFVAFFDETGESMFDIYVGREKHQLIESVREAFLALQARFRAPAEKRVLIAWSSVTGNTEKIARAAARGCPQALVAPVASAPEPEAFDTIFLAFWCDKGQIDAGARAYLERIRAAARVKGAPLDVAFFGTMGGNPESEKSIAWRDRVIDAEVGDGSLIRCIGRRLWQGRIDPKIVEAMNQMMPMTPERKARIDEAAKHPSKEDEAQAADWVRDLVKAA